MKAQKPKEQPASPPNLALKRIIVIGSVLTAAIVITLITGLLIVNALGGTRHEPKPAAAGVVVTTFATLPGDTAFPTGIARAADGTLYISAFGSGIIYKVSADGTLTPWLQKGSGITAPASIEFGPDGALYVLDFTSSNPGSGLGAIKRVTPDGKVSLYANAQDNAGLSFLSHLAFDGQGNLYVTYTVKQEVWRFPTNGQSGSWLKVSGVGSTRAQPTGIIYDKASNALIVGDAGSGTIYRIKIRDDGSADQPLVLYRQSGLTVQGLAIDEAGRLLVTDWAQDNGQLARIGDDGKFEVLAQGFRAPTDLVIAAGKIYVTNSDLPGLVPLLRAKPPFTVDVVSESGSAATPTGP